MSEIKRYYAEKKAGFDNEAKSLLDDIIESLNINSVIGLRILDRYDIEGVGEEFLNLAKSTILSEPPVEQLYEEEFPLAEDEIYFVKEYLPGQFDQCADSLIQCIQIISGAVSVQALAAKVFVLKGAPSGDELKRIEQYCHNPVDSRIGRKDKPASLSLEVKRPSDVQIMEGFIDKTDSQLSAMKSAEGYAMSVNDLNFCRNYFRDDEKRNPTITEIKAIDTYWSDHCRHTTFLTKLNDFKIDDGYYKEPIERAFNDYIAERQRIYKDREVPITLMDMAVMGMKSLRDKGLLEDLDKSDEINACSIVIDADVDGKDEKWLLMFKNETHNHPTEIEPFGGAATCLGGAIRDPLSGRAYVYQAMRITGAKDPTRPLSETLPGKLSQRKITTEAAHGFSSYGNQIGLTTGHVREIYHEGFVAKRMEIGAVVGATPMANVVRSKPQEGDVVVIVGGRTGRDGCGGATGSSKEHSVSSIDECGAEVQKGNAPTERKLQRLFRNDEAKRLIKKCNDFGAGGVCVAIGELADSLIIDLDSVLKKYEGLDGTELAISESQERMAVVVNREDAERFIELAGRENLEAVTAAEITDDGYMRMLWRGKEIVSLKRSFLDTNGAEQNAFCTIRNPEKFSYALKGEIKGDIRQSFINAVSDLNSCSQKGLVERFDATIGAATVLMPFGGENQKTPEDVMAAKLPVLGGETETVSVMSAAYDPDIFSISPFHGGIYAVVESVSRLVAAGCSQSKIRMSFQEYFEKMTTDPYTWGKPAAALLGAMNAEFGFKLPSIGGKDSMSGTFDNIHVPPVLTSFAIAATKAKRVKSAAFKGDKSVYIVMPEYDEFELPDYSDLSEKYELVASINEDISAAAAVKKFGIAEAVSKMCFGNETGFEFDKSFIDKYGMELLFAPLYGAVIIESAKDLSEVGGRLIKLGATDKSGILKADGFEIKVGELVAEWERPLERIFPDKYTAEKADANKYEPAPRKVFASIVKTARPNVFIPIFPGTNCEYDSARAFEKAGAETASMVFRNRSAAEITESIREMAKHIEKANIIMLPGGFSAGDEPNGCAKFIGAVFRNPLIKDAVMEHIKTKDGLMLGICNGFQALIKLGLLPFGEIRDMDESSPTLYYNEIGRHISQIVETKVISANTPFLAACKPGDIFKVAVSHGEGRFVATDSVIEQLKANGQIATVFVDGKGNETMKRPYNPNGSMQAVEGVISSCGRIFGKMGHSERIGESVYKNVPGEYDSKIFESAVKYYCGN